ncbi:MAG: hypothetical protein P1P90_05740 [Patescibacteria group bacterium]|nr:hypothetical protein [Patescibacteria group bacterium]
MNRLKIAKITEISAGIAFILLGVLVFGLSFISMEYGDKSVFLLIILLVMGISGVEAGLFWIKRFYLMKGGLEVETPKRFIAKAASAAVPMIFVITIISICFGIIGFSVAYYFLINYLLAGFGSLDMVWVTAYIVLILIYVFVLRMAFKNRFKDMLNDSLQKIIGEYPKVEIAGDDLVLHLGKGFLEQYRDLKIPLREIEDVKVLNRYEGMALLKYVLGPDIEFGVKSVSEKIKYQQGKIKIPKFFSYMENSTGAKTLYLAGPELLYLVGVQENEELKKLKSL